MDARRPARPAAQVYVPPGRRGLAADKAPDGGDRAEGPKRERQFQAYVPPGRRELNDKKELEERSRRERETAAGVASSVDLAHRASPVPRAKGFETQAIERSRPVVDDSAFATVIDDERLAASCLVVHGISADASDAARVTLTEPYVRMGGVVQWLGPQTCLLVFLNESVANRALAINSSAVLRPQCFSSTPFNNKEHLAGIRTLHSQLKPDRDSRVANRLIGAALGIRLPAPAAGGPRTTASTPSADTPMNDAWDDP